MILLDTNALIWLLTGSQQLGAVARTTIEADLATCYVSQVSLWEIATKAAIGKLDLKLDVPQVIEKEGFSLLRLRNEHIKAYQKLPLLHRDPFDRMLIAQAQVEQVKLLTSDDIFKSYDAKIVDAKV
jgi:PIN domain nuclease of toxin-antitoxin system